MATYFRYRRVATTYSSLLFMSPSQIGKNFAVLDHNGTTTKYVQLLPPSEAYSSYMRMKHTDGNTYAVATSNEYTVSSPQPIVDTEVANITSVAYGAGYFVATVSTPSTYILVNTGDGVTWTKKIITSVPRVWYTVRYLNNLFILVGPGLTLWASDSPGGTWYERFLPVNANWGDVSYVTGRYIAITINTSTNIGATSTDGTTWASITMPASVNWSAITSNGTTFCAINSTNANAYTTTDGVTWATKALPAASNYQKIAYGNSAFIAITSSTAAAISTDGAATFTSLTLPTSGTNIIYSTAWILLTTAIAYNSSDNGANWTIGNIIDPGFSSYYEIAWSGTYYIALGSSLRVARSTNSSTWTVVGTTNASQPLYSNGQISSVNNTHVLTGLAQNVYVSTTGNSWTRYYASALTMSITEVAGDGASRIVVLPAGTGNIVKTGDSWSNVTGQSTLPITSSYASICYGAGTFAICGAYYSQYQTTYYACITVSTNGGTTWSTNKLPGSSGAGFYKIRYGGTGTFVAVGSSCYSSTDYGVTFASRTLGITATSVAYGAGIWVAVPLSGTNARTSTDGITWAVMSMPVSASWLDITYGAGVFVAVASDLDTIYYSSTGLTGSWTAAPVGYNGSPGWRNISFANNLFCVQGSYCVAYSSNGSSWTLSATNFSGSSTLVSTDENTYLNGKNIIIRRDVDYFYHVTTDYATWTVYQGDSTSSSGQIQSIYFGSNYITTVADGIRYTPNFLDWTTVYPDYPSTWKVIASGNGKCISFTGTNNIYATSTNGTSWAPYTLPFENTIFPAGCSCYGNAFIFCHSYGQGDGIVKSTDNGATWVRNKGLYGNGGLEGHRDIAYGAGIYVVLSSASGTEYATSTDGVTWTRRNTLPVATGWASVAYGNGIFLAVGTGNYAATSADGINWTLRTVPTSINHVKVRFNGSYFLAISATPSAYTTTDGVTWTSKTISGPLSPTADLAWNGVTWLVISGNSTAGHTSSDATTWSAAQTLPVNAGGLCASGTTFILTSNSASTSCYYSTTGATGSWSTATLPVSAVWGKPAANGANVVVGVTGGSIAGWATSSNNGATWTQRTPAIGNSPVPAKAIYGGTTWVVARQSSTALYSTDNGVTWNLSQVIQPGGPIYAWSLLAYGNGVFMISDGGAISTSPDGNNWTARSGVPIRINDLIYANGFFFGTKYSGGGVYYSRDGASWTSVADSLFLTNVSSKISYDPFKNIFLGIGPDIPVRISSVI